MIGLACIPALGVEAAIKEMERCVNSSVCVASG